MRHTPVSCDKRAVFCYSGPRPNGTSIFSVPGIPSPSVARHRAQVATLKRWREPDDPLLIDAQRQLAEATLRQQIERTLAQKTLTAEQRTRLAELLGVVK